MKWIEYLGKTKNINIIELFLYNTYNPNNYYDLKNDIFKIPCKELCEKNNVKLICIPYTLSKRNEIKDYIIKSIITNNNKN